jgi:hypothetical protein
MRQLLSYAMAAAMVILACTADAATTPAKKKTHPKRSAVAAKKSTSHKTAPSTRKAAPSARKAEPSGTKATPSTKKGVTASRKGSSKKGSVKKATWRNRQLAPSPERYGEIQKALVAKGYLKPEDGGGAWNQASVDALKRFQAAQNLESNGKINSLSLIALGLGPKHDSTPAKTAETPQ